MIQKNWDLVMDHFCLLGEGPIWDPSHKRILWVDILQGEIHQFSVINNDHQVMQVGQSVGAIALNTKGGLIAALQHGFAAIDLDGKTIRMITNPESHLPNNRFNDGKCDPAGRFWAGTMDDVAGKEGAGNLYVLHQDLSVSVKLENVTCSNGLAWSPDRSTFYYIDTPTRQVVSYGYNWQNGDIYNKNAIITIPAAEGYPDGMTIDAEGMLWIAHWDGWKVSRWDPSKGELLETILLPVSRITSCTFGGEQLEDLYITSASVGLSESQLKEQPLAGALFVIKNVGVKGSPAAYFPG